MSEELYYRHYFLQIYEILREDEQNKKLSIKEKNVLADDDEILKSIENGKKAFGFVPEAAASVIPVIMRGIMG